jgi:hypothetical protein
MPKVCFRHQRINEDGAWEVKHDLSAYMLWIKKPVLIARCQLCDEEQNVRDTINELREADK